MLEVSFSFLSHHFIIEGYHISAAVSLFFWKINFFVAMVIEEYLKTEEKCL